MLAGIIKARVEMILQQVDYELKNDSYDKMLIAGIVLTGGGSKLKHIAQYTEYITGITTRIGEPDNIWLGENASDSADPIYSTGIGLVLKGFEYESRLNPDIDVQQDSDNDGNDIPVTEEPKDKQSNKGGRLIDKVGKFFEKILNNTVQ